MPMTAPGPASPLGGPSWARSAAALAAGGWFTFRALAASFAEAQRACPAETHVSTYRLAGHAVRLRVVGDALAQAFAEPLAPRRAPIGPEGAALQIDAWDEAVTGVPCAASPADPRLGPFGTVTYSEDARFVAYQRPEATSWLDLRQGRIVGWVRSVDALYLDERAKPFHKLLFVWLRDRGPLLVHAGLVAHADQGVLLVGKGGAGKSTAALAGLLGGLDFLGDDFVAMTEEPDGAFRGHGCFAASLLDQAHLPRFPALAAGALRPNQAHERKALLPVAAQGAGRFPASAAIRALALPRVVDASRATLRPATRGAALLALAPSSLFLLPRPRHEGFEQCVRLVERVPAYWLELGRELDSIAPCLDALVHRPA